MPRPKALDIEGRTLLIRLCKSDTPIKDIAYILKVSRAVVYGERQKLRASGLIDAPLAIKKNTLRPTNDSKDPRQNRATRTCLGCGKDFDSAWIGNRSCKNCSASAAGTRAIK